MVKREFWAGKVLWMILVGVLLGMAFSLSQAEAASVKFASFSLGTSWYNYANYIAPYLRKALPPDTAVEVLPYAGGMGNLRLIQEKKVDLGLVFDCQLAWAYDGEVTFKGKPNKNLRRLVGNMDQYYIVFVARKDFPANSIDEIIQKKLPAKFCTQPEGGSSIVALRQILELKGASEADLKSWGGSIKFANAPPALAEMVKSGQADIWSQPAPQGHPTVAELAQTADVKFLELENETAEKMKKKFFYENLVMPKDTFRGQGDTRSVGFSTAIAVMDDMNEELAYKITKAIYDNRKQLGQTDAGLRNFEMTKDSMGYVPLHRGSEKYFKEIGLVK